MPITDLLLEGLKLMLLGMVSVFGFLMLLVLVMTGVSRLATAVGGTQPVEQPAATPPSGTRVGDEDVIAVISAAIARYRATRI